MENYIEDKKNLYIAILELLQNSDDKIDEKSFGILSQFFNKQGTDENLDEMQDFLQIIKNISDNHHRDPNFFGKINQIFQHYKDRIKQTFSNDEIFQLFEDNKLLLLFLMKTDILTLTDSICETLLNKFELNGNRYCYFFYPELENFLGAAKMEDHKKLLLLQCPTAFENYEEKRQKGENESIICSMIRNDSVEEFISYVTRKSYPLSSQITPSIFETNSFLIKQKETRLIEYSAFYGSIQIFQFLMLRGAEMTSSLWLYVIHSNNAELLHMLESNNVSPPEFTKTPKLNTSSNKYLKCFVESIKCHHNDFANYIENNLLLIDEIESNQEEKIIGSCIKYRNYSYFKNETVKNHGFFYLCYYKYDQLVKLLLKNKEKEIELKIIQYSNVFNQEIISLQFR